MSSYSAYKYLKNEYSTTWCITEHKGLAPP
jgi:hypothetical protein